MNTTLDLPLPSLSKGRFASLGLWTDDALEEATGVRIAFAERTGGKSTGPYASLNLAYGSDDEAAVDANRALLLEALGLSPQAVVSPRQVHGMDVVEVASTQGPAYVEAMAKAAAGADAVAVDVVGVAALLCFADCVPLIMVAPTGRFVVAHAGWRGAVAGIASLALKALTDGSSSGSGQVQVAPDEVNIYVGPYIHSECFEVGEEVEALFRDTFGDGCITGNHHVDLGEALRIDLVRAGASRGRIVEVGACTLCDQEAFFSYRGSSGVCGRHGAFAMRAATKAQELS